MASLESKAATQQIHLEVCFSLLESLCDCTDNNPSFTEDGPHAHLNPRIARVGLEDHSLTRRVRNIRAHVTKIDEHLGSLASYLSDFEDALADSATETL